MSKFDEILNQVKNETPTDVKVSEAAGRVRSTLFGPGSTGAAQLSTCADFESLMPAHLQKTLPDARRMLLEDHLRECVHCRHAWDRLRGAGPKVRPMPVPPPKSGFRSWAVAATVIVGLGVAGMAARSYVPALSTGPKATVVSVEGVAYRQMAEAAAPVGEGTELADGEEIRTPASTRAILRLWDGSRVEMNERASLTVSTGWRGTTIRLERGHIIVQAAKQKMGKLFVSTGDSEVAVVGTIFSVNKGTLGARVSVVEGQVNVAQNGQTQALKPGEQTTTNAALDRVAVQEEVAWSKDAARYTALLAELTTLQKRLETVPANGLRYQSRLLLFTPDDTRMLAALPNIGVTLAESKRIFDEQLRTSPVLRDWWNSAANATMRREVEMLVETVKMASALIGEEVLVFVSNTDTSVVAETKNAASLEAFLKQGIPGSPKIHYALKGDFVVISETPAALQRMSAIVARGSAPSTPLRERVEQSYRSGAGWIFAVDLEQKSANSVSAKKKAANAGLGLDKMQYAIFERRDVAAKTENRATVSFRGAREGAAAWLATPGPMSTLNFVSPDAGAAASIVVKQPRTIVEELMQVWRKADAGFDAKMLEMKRELGLDPVDDLAAPLGTEATVALDGPLLPVPSWKVAVEVNQPQRLQASLEKLLDVANRTAAQKQVSAMKLVKEQVGGRLFYKIDGGVLPTEIHWTYVDNYWVVAASRNLITQAIQNRQTGLTLARSERFRAQLPAAGNPNFSAVVYHNLGSVLGPLVDQFGGLLNATPEQQQSMQAVKQAQPGLIAAYAESDRITAAAVGNLFGLNLGMFAGPGGLFQSVLQTPGKQRGYGASH